MSRIKIGDDWWTSPAEGNDGSLIMVTGHGGLEPIRATGRYNIRVEISWTYPGDRSGMPDVPTSQLMEAVQEALTKVFDHDPVAVLTGIYTGAGRRDWIFYTTSVHIFNRKLNEALAPFDLLPIRIYTENDPDWEEYDEMVRESRIESSDD